MPAEQDAAEAAEFSALVAELSAEEVTEESGDEEVAQNDPSTDSGDEEAAEEPEEETEPEDLEQELTAAELEASKLFAAGDIAAACKRLGIDPKIFKVRPREFTAMRKGLQEAEKKLTQATTFQRQGEQLHTAAEQTYGPIVAGFKGHQEGRPLDVKSAIELMCEDTFENVVAGIARAAKGLSPAEAELLKIRQERAQEKQADAARKAQETESARETQEVQALTARLKGTPLEKVPDASKEIRAIVVASFDGVGYSKTVKDAYAEVKAKYAGIAEAVTGKKLTARKLSAPPGKQRVALAPLRTAPLSAKDKAAAQKAAEAEEFRASVREASAAGNRMGVRYGRS